MTIIFCDFCKNKLNSIDIQRNKLIPKQDKLDRCENCWSKYKCDRCGTLFIEKISEDGSIEREETEPCQYCPCESCGK